MAKFVFSFCFLFWSALGLTQTKPSIWTAADRQSLIIELKSSQHKIMKEVEGLTEDQMHFKPGINEWSIAEIIEHVAVYEELLYWDLLNNQYTPERPDLVDSVKGVDAAMVEYATDPNKGQAPFAVQPMGRFQTKRDLLGFFNRYRDEVIKLIEETKVDFRLHFIFRPADWGVWHIRDLHQYTLLWISHTERHLNQIRRVERSPQFPK